MAKIKKDFSIMKWLVFPFLVLCGAITLAYCSTYIFGFEGSVPYYLMLFGFFVISLILILHCGNTDNKPAQVASFVFEGVGIIVLVIVSAMAIMSMREITAARAVTDANNNTLQKVSQLKSARGQNTLIQAGIVKPVDQMAIIQKIENRLNIGFIFEASIYFLGIFVVYGLVLFWKPSAQSQQDEEPEQESKPAKTTVRLSQPKTVAPLKNPTKTGRYNSISNGKNSFRLRETTKADAIQLSWRQGRNKEKFIATVTEKEADKLSPMSYDQLREYCLSNYPNNSKML